MRKNVWPWFVGGDIVVAVLLSLLALVFLGMIVGYFLVVKNAARRPLESEQDRKQVSSEEEELKNILVTTEIQEVIDHRGCNKVVVGAANHAAQVFTGNISIRSIDPQGQVLTWEMLRYKDLLPGKTEYRVCWLKLSQPPQINVEVTGGFRPFPSWQWVDEQEELEKEPVLAEQGLKESLDERLLKD